MITPQEEAEDRYLGGLTPASLGDRAQRMASVAAFVSGAEWLASEIGLTVEQVQRLGPLVEAARKYNEDYLEWGKDADISRLLAAVAALDGDGV